MSHTLLDLNAHGPISFIPTGNITFLFFEFLNEYAFILVIFSGIFKVESFSSLSFA